MIHQIIVCEVAIACSCTKNAQPCTNVLIQSEISNYTCICSERWGSSSIHVLQSAYLFILWLHKMEYSINELHYTVCNILYIVTELQYTGCYVYFVGGILFVRICNCMTQTPNPLNSPLIIRMHFLQLANYHQ